MGMGMKKAIVLIGWFFLAWGASESPRTVVGPFDGQANCEAPRKDYMTQNTNFNIRYSTFCWYTHA